MPRALAGLRGSHRAQRGNNRAPPGPAPSPGTRPPSLHQRISGLRGSHRAQRGNSRAPPGPGPSPGTRNPFMHQRILGLRGSRRAHRGANRALWATTSSSEQCTATICPGASPPRYAYAGCRAWPLPNGADSSGIHHQLLVDRTSAHSNNGSSPSVVDKTRLPPSARASSPRYRSSPGPSLKVLVVPSRPDIPSVSTRQNATAAGSNAQDIEVHTDMDHCSATKTLSH